MAKHKNSKKILGKKSNRGQLVMFAVLLLLVIVAVISKEWPRHRSALVANDAVSSSVDEASTKIAWLQVVIQEKLEEARKDPVPGVKSLTAELFRRLETRLLGMAISPSYDGRTVAGIVVSPESPLPMLTFAGPELEKIKTSLSDDQFRDYLLVISLHEVIHQLYTPLAVDKKLTQSQYILGEAKAWALTVTMLIRPLQKAGRYVSVDSIEAEKAFKACENNSQSKRWIKWISAHRCINNE